MAGPTPSLHLHLSDANHEAMVALFNSNWVSLHRVQSPAGNLRHLAVVVDGSMSLKGQGGAIAQALATIPENYSLSLWVAGETGVHLPMHPATQIHKAQITKILRNVPFKGGQKNVKTLRAALMELEPYKDAQMLWITGPQPVSFPLPYGPQNPLQKMSWLPPMTLYSVLPGPNNLQRGLIFGHEVRYLSHCFGIERDLELWLNQFHQPHWQTVLQTSDNPPASPKAVDKFTEESVRRLWANKETKDLLAAGEGKLAEAFAVKQRLITPLTAAVVIELADSERRIP